MILGFPEYDSQARRLADAAERRYALVDVHHFPDGESKVTVPTELPERVVFCRSLDHPNDKLIELMLAARTAREQGVRHITLVAPYLCYMRQDIAFNPGEAVSQQVVGHFLAELFDTVITVDPHLHRVANMDEVVPGIRGLALSAAEPMGRFLEQRLKAPLLIGPDSESEQWVRAIAERAHLDYLVGHKERLDDRNVRTALPEAEFQGREVVVIDDMVSTGNTLISVLRQLMEAGAGPVHCLFTHALLSEETERRLHKAGFRGLWSSDSVAHTTNAIPLAGLLATALTQLD